MLSQTNCSFVCLSLLQSSVNGNMNENHNGPSRSGSPGDEDIPLISITPSLSRRKRAQDLSQLSLQSAGSHDFVAPVAENGGRNGRYGNGVSVNAKSKPITRLL